MKVDASRRRVSQELSGLKLSMIDRFDIMSEMKISKYQRLFGVGPAGFAIGIVLLFLLWILGKKIGHAEILINQKPILIAGILLILLWGCWHAWCANAIKNWWRDGKLCTQGPYRLVRHPIYAGAIFLASPGVALAFNSWTMLFCPVLMFPIWTGLVLKEERMMASVFGAEYTNYATRTGRLFPKFWQ